MAVFIICRVNGRAEIKKEYHGSKEQIKELVMFYIRNYPSYICTAQSKEEAEKLLKELNGN